MVDVRVKQSTNEIARRVTTRVSIVLDDHKFGHTRLW